MSRDISRDTAATVTEMQWYLVDQLLMLGALLQLATHSWIAVLLFMWIGDSYEVHGSRLVKVHTYTPRSSTVMLCILLANSVPRDNRG